MLESEGDILQPKPEDRAEPPHPGAPVASLHIFLANTLTLSVLHYLYTLLSPLGIRGTQGPTRMVASPFPSCGKASPPPDPGTTHAPSYGTCSPGLCFCCSPSWTISLSSFAQSPSTRLCNQHITSSRNPSLTVLHSHVAGSSLGTTLSYTESSLRDRVCVSCFFCPSTTTAQLGTEQQVCAEWVYVTRTRSGKDSASPIPSSLPFGPLGEGAGHLSTPGPDPQQILNHRGPFTEGEPPLCS